MPPTDVILRPVHLPGIKARTAEEFRAVQRRILTRSGNPTEPIIVTEPIAAHVGAGAWRVRCLCGEAPPADPEWRLSCCGGCGRVYEQVEFPVNRADIEALLVRRPRMKTRNWQQPETVGDLLAENAAHGVA